MPLDFARRLTGRHRTAAMDRRLGVTLAFVAGAINAGGFLAVKQYTSHMTGIVSSIADGIVLGTTELVFSSIGGLLFFLIGAAASAIMVNFARRRRMNSQYSLPLLLEAGLLLCFGILGARLSQIESFFLPITVMLLCFIMGLQNALISKLSRAEIRTTHLTGIITDIGIEIGKSVYWNSSRHTGELPVAANRSRLALLGSLAGAFFIGGVTGAIGFHRIGYVSTVPLALVLISLAVVPAVDDFGSMLASRRGRRASVE